MNKFTWVKNLVPTLVGCCLYLNVSAQNVISGQIQNGYTDVTGKNLVNSPNTATLISWFRSLPVKLRQIFPFMILRWIIFTFRFI